MKYLWQNDFYYAIFNYDHVHDKNSNELFTEEMHIALYDQIM